MPYLRTSRSDLWVKHKQASICVGVCLIRELGTTKISQELTTFYTLLERMGWKMNLLPISISWLHHCGEFTALQKLPSWSKMHQNRWRLGLRPRPCWGCVARGGLDSLSRDRKLWFFLALWSHIWAFQKFGNICTLVTLKGQGLWPIFKMWNFSQMVRYKEFV